MFSASFPLREILLPLRCQMMATGMIIWPSTGVTACVTDEVSVVFCVKPEETLVESVDALEGEEYNVTMSHSLHWILPPLGNPMPPPRHFQIHYIS